MKKIVVYVHGKGGSATEAAHYEPLFPECEVIGFDYQAQLPWTAREEFAAYFESLSKRYDQIILIANSIGAYYALLATGQYVTKAFLISPIVDMEKLIRKMMDWAHVSEAELQERKTIETDFNETLSWDYLDYVRKQPLNWNVETEILYGERDNLTDPETIRAFASRIDAKLTIMEDGEHWFHTPEQLRFLDDWLKRSSVEGVN